MAARTLPLFPLPLVLFPGIALPLHIFEPRYRRMLADCLEGDRRFGLIFLPDATPERELPSGQVGCVARVESAQSLPDGRSNIIVAGEERFALEALVDGGQPYHVGRVREYHDVPEAHDALDALASEVLALFGRVARAARVLGDDRSPIPDLPADAALLAYRIAALVDTTVEMRYDLLRSRSAIRRLREVEALLDAAVGSLERRALMHERAKANGRGHGAAPEAGA